LTLASLKITKQTSFILTPIESTEIQREVLHSYTNQNRIKSKKLGQTNKVEKSKEALKSEQKGKKETNKKQVPSHRKHGKERPHRRRRRKWRRRLHKRRKSSSFSLLTVNSLSSHTIPDSDKIQLLVNKVYFSNRKLQRSTTELQF